jgi:hypothetical protein
VYDLGEKLLLQIGLGGGELRAGCVHLVEDSGQASGLCLRGDWLDAAAVEGRRCEENSCEEERLGGEARLGERHCESAPVGSTRRPLRLLAWTREESGGRHQRTTHAL